MIQKFQKKPVVLNAVRLEKTSQSILEVTEFINNKKVDNHSCKSAEDAWERHVDKVLSEGGIFLKTPESDNETQKLYFGDYCFEGFDSKNGRHVYPVSSVYVEENYVENLGNLIRLKL